MVKVHTFPGTASEPVSVAEDALDDEGAPPPLPGGAQVRVTVFDAKGDLVSSSPTPQDIERDRQAALARTPPAPKPAASPSPVPPTRAGAPLDARAARLRCLEIATRGGETSPLAVLDIARQLYAFVEDGA